MTLHRQARLSLAIAFTLIATVSLSLNAVVPDATIFQGRAVEAGIPVQGIVDLTIRLYTTPTGGVPVSTWTASGVEVLDGYFSVALTGLAAVASASPALFLAIEIDSQGELEPRQPVLSSVYALAAADAERLGGQDASAYGDVHSVTTSAGSGLAGGGTSGDLVLSLLPCPDGSTLQRLGSAWTCGSAAGSAWSRTGNAGTTPGTDFLGTTDGQPLEVRVGGAVVTRFIPTLSSPSVVMGAQSNALNGTTEGVFIGGGAANSASGRFAVVGGGSSNRAGGPLAGSTVAEYAAVLGGNLNQADGRASAVLGGESNVAAGDGGFVGGGQSNDASGRNASAVGGQFNVASGNESTVLGGRENFAAGRVSLAAGEGAAAAHDGAFVWASGLPQFGLFSSTGPNQFLIRAPGGVGINHNQPEQMLHLRGSSPAVMVEDEGSGAAFLRFNRVADPGLNYVALGLENRLFVQLEGTDVMVIAPEGRVGINHQDPQHPIHVGSDSSNGNGAHLTAGGMWMNGSDRRHKDGIEPVDPQEVLERLATLPISTWHYRAEAPEVRHLGPMAQDFHATFRLGSTDTHIGTADADGIALAAIQALLVRLDQQRQELEELRRRLDDLEH